MPIDYLDLWVNGKNLEYVFGARWDSNLISYTFLNANQQPSYYQNGSFFNSSPNDIINTSDANLTTLSDIQKDAVHFLLDSTATLNSGNTFANQISYRVSFSDIVNVNFHWQPVDTNNPDNIGDITFTNAKLVSQKNFGEAILPTGNGILPTDGDIVISNVAPDVSNTHVQLGDGGVWIFLHELGHGYGGLGDVSTVSSLLQTPFFDRTIFDNQKYTVMSYHADAQGFPISSPLPYTLQLLDIVGIQ